MTDSAYVDKIYLNVLGIAGDVNGRAFWTNAISSGSVSRTDFVADFISGVLDYDSAKDTTSTATQKADALTAQTAIKSKVGFSQEWVASSNATDATKTGVDAKGTYVAANDQSVSKLAVVKDVTTLGTQLTNIGVEVSHFLSGNPNTDSIVVGLRETTPTVFSETSGLIGGTTILVGKQPDHCLDFVVPASFFDKTLPETIFSVPKLIQYPNDPLNIIVVEDTTDPIPFGNLNDILKNIMVGEKFVPVQSYIQCSNWIESNCSIEEYPTESSNGFTLGSGFGSGFNHNNTSGGFGGNDTSGDSGNLLTTVNSMSGGKGSDVFFVDNVSDKTIETENGGKDLVISKVDYILPDNTEILTLATESAINGTGNILDNTLIGNIAANVLDGGVGADVFVGRAGNDTYIVDNIGDKVLEIANEGVDLVKSFITYTLPDNVENLTLTGNAAINGTGNALDNVITGNGADNVIDGGAGNDTFVLKGGTDVSKANLTLVNIENIGFDSAGGTMTFSAAQLSAKTYNIKGSAATDSLIIKGSSDTTTVDVSKLKITSVETVTLDNSASTTAQNLVGVITLDKLNNNLISGNGNDTVNGGFDNDSITGGAGNDSLSGGLGSDTYVFKAGDSGAPSATSFDTIVDFTKGGQADFANGADKITFTTATPSVAAGISSSVAGKATISAQGLATFDAADTTLSSHINAIANTLSTLGAVATWQEAADTYLFIDGDGAASPTPNALDVLIKLSGIIPTGISLTAENAITII